MSKSKNNRYNRTPTPAVTQAPGVNSAQPAQPSQPPPQSPPQDGIVEWLKATPKTISGIHKMFWIGIVIFYLLQILAGGIDSELGHGSMLLFQMVLVFALGYIWTLPSVLGAQIFLSGIFSSSDKIDAEQALQKVFGTSLRWFINTCAYTIGMVITVLLLLDIRLGFGEMVGLLAIGLILGIVTAAIGTESKIALQIAQAGLIACVVKVAILHIPQTAEASVLRELIVNNVTAISLLTMVIVLIGFGWAKVGWEIGLGILVKFFRLLHPKRVIGLLITALVLGSVVFFVYWLYDPVQATQRLNAKVTEIDQANKVNVLETNTIFNSTSSSSKDVSAKPTNGKAVIAQKTLTSYAGSCNLLLKSVDFEPNAQTFTHKPLLETVPSGKYLLKAGGSRKQWFLVNGKVNYYRALNANGDMLDASPVQQWITNDALFPDKAYGGIVAHVGDEVVYIGSEKTIIVVNENTPISLDINVFQHPDNYTSTESTVKVTLFKCL